MGEESAEHAHEERWSLPPVALLPLSVVLWWGAGFLPWLFDGLRQTQGPIGAGGAVGGRLALPLLTTQLTQLSVQAVIGGMVAGALVLLVDHGRRWRGAAASFAGVALSVGATLWQSWTAVERNALGDFPADTRVLTGLAVALVVCTLAGWVTGAVTGLGRLGVGFALAVAAGIGPAYLSILLYSALDSVAPLRAVDVVVDWCGVVLVALALAVVGWRPWWHAVLWPVVLLVSLLIGPLLTSVGYLQQLLSPGGLPGGIGDALSAAVQVFTEAAVSSSVNRPLHWIVAVVLGVGLALWQHRRDGSHSPRLPEPPIADPRV